MPNDAHSGARLQRMQALLAENPDDVFLNYSLAMEQSKVGQWKEAVATFDRVLDLDPQYVPAHFQKGQTLAAAEQIAPARQAIEQGIEVARAVGDDHALGEMVEFRATLR